MFWIFKTIDPRKEVEKEMCEKYGDNWLDQCLEALKDKRIRDSLAEHFKTSHL